MAGESKLVMHTKLTGEYALSVFASRKQKLAEIPLGGDKVEAEKQVKLLQQAFRETDGYEDQTA